MHPDLQSALERRHLSRQRFALWQNSCHPGLGLVLPLSPASGSNRLYTADSTCLLETKTNCKSPTKHDTVPRPCTISRIVLLRKTLI